MPWITIPFETLKAYLLDIQLNAIEELLLGVGQTSPFEEILPGVLSRIRNEVSARGKNILDPDPNKIPGSLKGEAAALIIEAMQPRIQIELSEDQRRAADHARSYLKRIGAGDVTVDDVTTAGVVQSITGTPSITPKTRYFTRSSMDGF